MAPRMSLGPSTLLALGLLLLLLPCQVHAFGAGNIASISKVEGKNWRHGDIEDTLKTIAFIKGHKWTSNMVKRVYFGNWLRDYSQAMDVGTLKSLPADTIRILVWVLSFLSFGYATAEFEVTADRLGVYRPEEHIDNPKDYADNEDARKYDDRLRGPIRQVELDIDPDTGMKNYIANERGDWATSAAYIKYSLARSIHHGRLYTSGHRKGNEEDLFEALRCLGQGLHTLEDFAAHTNYVELTLRELGFRNVFPHTGTQTQINLRGHHVYPLVTGTFGMVDFFHSVLGEATDHFTQSEINEMDTALGDAQSSSSANSLNSLTGLLGKVPGCGDLVAEAEALKRRSEAQQSSNTHGAARSGYAAAESTRGFNDDSERSRGGFEGGYEQSRASAPSSTNKPTGLPGKPDFNPAETIAKIYPILEFRDKVVRKISSVIEKIPGLESLVEKITETLTVFIMSLLAPFIRPIINAASQSLQTGSAGVIESSGKHQFEPWTNPHCTDPTHSMLSKDHFSNVLNEPAGNVAAAILTYVTPRVLHAWENINIPEQQVLHDSLDVFHHPALRNMRNEAHRAMFEAVQTWANAKPGRGAKLDDVLSSEGVRTGKNNGGEVGHSHAQGGFPAVGGAAHGASHHQTSSHGYAPQQHHQQSHQSSHQPSHQQHQQSSNSGSQLPWEKLSDQLNSLPIPGISNINKLTGKLSSFGLGGSSRDEQDSTPPPPQQHHYDSHSQPHHASHTPPPPHHQSGPGGYGAPSYDSYSQPPQHHDGGYGHNQSGYGHPPPPQQGYGGGYGQGHQDHSQRPPPHHQHEHGLGQGHGYGQGHGQGHGQGYGQGYGGYGY
ncbi:heterokaryon incompatibility protein Het-C-domain-containing protein [Aspergillus crustosus]